MPNALQSDVMTMMLPPTPDVPVPVAFAKLRLGDTTYTVGECSKGRLFFLTEDTAAWRKLDCTLEDGWHEIGARVLMATRDALHDYLRMHMIRLTLDNASGTETRYDIGGFVWDLRPVSADVVAVRFPLHDWRHVNVSAIDPKSSPREYAIAVFSAARPDLGKTVAENVHAWAKRLAAGALVTPIM